MKKNLFLLLTLLSLQANAIKIDAVTAGAKPDGKTLNTQAIAKAIAEIDRNGGGTLYFPSGSYLTGPITLCNNITVELESGANIIFSDNFDDYLPYVEMRYEGVVMKSFNPLIYATDKQNITIKGAGTLIGQGTKWWHEAWRIEGEIKEKGEIKDPNKYQKMWVEANDVKALYDDNEPNYFPTLRRMFFRPPFIQLLRCKDITIDGITIKESPFWTVNPEFCRNITINNVTIVNPPSPNTDGINPSSCKDVKISNCNISVGDDCITIKSGRDAQARRIGIPCENILVTNCVMHSGHGGVVIGSEMSGGVRNVAITNCVFDGTDRGIRVKSNRGRGGVIEAITVSNIVMRNIKKEAIVMDFYYSGGAGTVAEFDPEKTPIIRNFIINSVTGYNVAQPIMLRGLKESPISNIIFSNINITCDAPNSFENCVNLRLDNVFLNGVEQHVSEK